MKKKVGLLAKEELQVDLTFHNVPDSLVIEFTRKIVRPYYQGNLNRAIQDLLQKAVAEQEYVNSHVAYTRNRTVAGA
jgi:hypothetical protein